MLAEVLNRAAKEFPDRIAYVSAEGWGATFGQLDQFSDECAVWLSSRAGVREGDVVSLVMPSTESKSVDYELTYLHKEGGRRVRQKAGKYNMAKHVFKATTKASAAAVSSISFARNRVSVNAPEAVVVETPQYGVATVSDMRLAGPDLIASSYTEATQKYEALLARRPELTGQVQILAHHELNAD